MIENYLLYIIAAVMLVAAAGVVTVRNIFHSGLLLGVTLLGVAGMYLLLGTEFLAAVQVLVYVGGILTLILFAVMLTRRIADRNIPQASERKAPAFFISAAILALMAYGIVKTPLEGAVEPPRLRDIAAVGKTLFVQYILPFEVVSVLLLVALVGAIILARKEPEK